MESRMHSLAKRPLGLILVPVIYLFTSLENNILYTYHISNIIQYSSSGVMCYDKRLMKAFGQYEQL